MKDTKKSFEETQKAELESWFSDDPIIERDKRIREIIRYPLLKRQMGLDHLDTSHMEVWDIGCGPFGGVSTLLRARRILRIDPLIKEYEKHYPIQSGLAMKAEAMILSVPDLVIVTNALDHFENPDVFLSNLKDQLRPGAFFAHIHAINNAYSHPHEAHAHNVNPELMNYHLQDDFELVWNLDYQHDGLVYGWRKQPAFSQLWRKTTGYA